MEAPLVGDRGVVVAIIGEVAIVCEPFGAAVELDESCRMLVSLMFTKLVRISLPKKFRKLRFDDGPPPFDLFGESVSFRLFRAESFR